MRELVSALRRNAAAIPDVRINAGVMIFLFAVAAAIGIGMGLMPLLLVQRDGLRGSERGSSTSKWTAQLRNGIGVAQIAFCVVLLAAAALLMESFLRMSNMRTGIRTDQVTFFRST